MLHSREGHLDSLCLLVLSWNPISAPLSFPLLFFFFFSYFGAGLLLRLCWRTTAPSRSFCACHSATACFVWRVCGRLLASFHQSVSSFRRSRWWSWSTGTGPPTGLYKTDSRRFMIEKNATQPSCSSLSLSCLKWFSMDSSERVKFLHLLPTLISSSLPWSISVRPLPKPCRGEGGINNLHLLYRTKIPHSAWFLFFSLSFFFCLHTVWTHFVNDALHSVCSSCTLVRPRKGIPLQNVARPDQSSRLTPLEEPRCADRPSTVSLAELFFSAALILCFRNFHFASYRSTSWQPTRTHAHTHCTLAVVFVTHKCQTHTCATQW